MTKRACTLLSALTLLSAGQATAGALSDPIVEAPVGVATTETWQGFRIGLTYNSTISSDTFATSEGFPFIDNPNTVDDAFGGFLGYDQQRGNFVYGAEIQALARDSVVQGFPTRSYGDLASVRGRFGLATGRTLVYGSVGYAVSEFDDAGTSIDLDGYVAGFGIEHMLTPNAFVGLAVDHYVLTGEQIATAVETKDTIVQIRIGLHF